MDDYFDDFDEYGDWDAMQTAEDYNVWETEQVYRDMSLEQQDLEDQYEQAEESREEFREEILAVFRQTLTERWDKHHLPRYWANDAENVLRDILTDLI